MSYFWEMHVDLSSQQSYCLTTCRENGQPYMLYVKGIMTEMQHYYRVKEQSEKQCYMFSIQND